ncbi:MAG: hypothetical protein OES32_04260 [Acidobacteriota bacterium]|nr:hypothetical protein [Acidobacteriota bacterium]
MTDAPMSLTAPLARGWDRMVQMLFRPFDLAKWLVVGFAAWLAGLADGGNYGGSYGPGSDGDAGMSREKIVEDARAGWEWLLAHELVAGLIAAGCLLLLVLVLVVLWVSSRGKFVFLDNVVHDRAEIAAPWTRFRRLGNSLFFFRLVAGLVCIPVALGLAGLGAWLALRPGGWAHEEGVAAIAGIAGTAALAAVAVVAALYLFFFLNAYVVPLMHRHDLGVLAAWRRFLDLAWGHWGSLVLSGLFVFVLYALAFSAIVVTGFMTCCLGFLLLALPYVGTVLLLPLIVTYRAFTVEFIAQLDPELGLR